MCAIGEDSNHILRLKSKLPIILNLTYFAKLYETTGFKWWRYVKINLEEKRTQSNNPSMLKDANEFCTFLCKLHTIPSNIADLERIFFEFFACVN